MVVVAVGQFEFTEECVAVDLTGVILVVVAVFIDEGCVIGG